MNESIIHRKSDHAAAVKALRAGVLVALLLADAVMVAAQMRSSTWFFLPAEIGAAYQYQENYGARIRNPLPAQGCSYGKVNFIASYRGTAMEVPCRFINELSRHLQAMLEIGAARYLFPLDADHAHLAVPKDVWERKYAKLPTVELMGALLRGARASGALPHGGASRS